MRTFILSQEIVSTPRPKICRL